MSKAGDLYAKIYGCLCGEPPQPRPWHFQWLSVRDLHKDLRQICPRLEGRLLDVGCGKKPYRAWCGAAVKEHVGIDVFQGPEVDVLIEQDKQWPLEPASFDAVLCTQVLEHVPDFDHTTAEICRVLRPGGLLVVTVPFAYNEHGSPYDFRRLSYFGVNQIFRSDYEILEMRREGAIGSTTVSLFLNWVDSTLNRNLATRLLKAVILPVWILVCLMMNIVGVVFDALDSTQSFYGNVLLYARKRTRREVVTDIGAACASLTGGYEKAID